MAAGYRIGIDVGGTFTDFILVRPDGEIALSKTPTTWPDQSVGVMEAIAELAAAENLDTGFRGWTGRVPPSRPYPTSSRSCG